MASFFDGRVEFSGIEYSHLRMAVFAAEARMISQMSSMRSWIPCAKNLTYLS